MWVEEEDHGDEGDEERQKAYASLIKPTPFVSVKFLVEEWKSCLLHRLHSTHFSCARKTRAENIQ